jgi:hypothetical protein
MLNLFKKPEEAKAEAPQPSAGLAFETGKEVQFKDPKSGEFVYQRAISPEHRKLLMDAMQKNAQCANRFMQVCRQELMFSEQKSAINKEIIASEKEINDHINVVRDDLKLDRRWGLNLQLGVLERRDPPNG